MCRPCVCDQNSSELVSAMAISGIEDFFFVADLLILWYYILSSPSSIMLSEPKFSLYHVVFTEPEGATVE